uniref:Uncharacterized protein n=1 Tax=Rhizophora mucronata TaxID=61149 RepID=A0A2P2IYZ6_RHIMU
MKKSSGSGGFSLPICFIDSSPQKYITRKHTSINPNPTQHTLFHSHGTRKTGNCREFWRSVGI